MTEKNVKFKHMKDGDKEDYLLLQKYEEKYVSLTYERIIEELTRQGKNTMEGYKITRLDHGLQSATRAYNDGADIDWIVGALLHDIGDGLAPQNHDRFSAEVVRPYVRDEITWVIEHHGIFQMIYYAHHYGWDKNARDKFKDNIYYKSCSDFCERWDQSCFDPNYKYEPIEFFEPMIREVFKRKAYDPANIKYNQVFGLPLI
jgi:predicted HD phosphohydrolase